MSTVKYNCYLIAQITSKLLSSGKLLLKVICDNVIGLIISTVHVIFLQHRLFRSISLMQMIVINIIKH